MTHKPHEVARFSKLAWTLGVLALVVAGRVSVHAQPVQGDVRCVGFQAAVPSRFIVRHGQWFPIQVTLTAQSSRAQEVELRYERKDLDGDRVTYVEPYVAVTPGSVRRVWCYAVSLKEDVSLPMQLDVVDRRDDTLLTTLQVPMFEPISNDTQLILDISKPRVARLNVLDSGQIAYNDLAWGNREYYRSICVASLPAQDLPDRWWGLEAVDVIVWDEPTPEALPNPAQLTALIEWVENGGQLVLGIGPAWTKVQKSALARIVPLVGDQPPVEVSELKAFAARYARSRGENFKSPISVAVGNAAPDAVVTFQDRFPGLLSAPLNLIAMKPVGSGRVIATAARLRDLTSLNPRREFYQQLFDLNPNESRFRENEAKEMFWGARPLYEPLIAPIAFRRLASARVLAACAFVAAYILLSTFGVWSWLKRRKLTHVSWTTFAGFAVAASALSLAAVGLLRGVTGAVHSVSFVDLQAGSGDARIWTYFGYKSPRRQRADLSLADQGGYLRPLATGALGELGEYATPARYDAVPGEAALQGTLMRATLKQFEGFSHGRVLGGIRGSLSADRQTGMITPLSWVQNDLDVDIDGGYLLYIDPRLRERDGGVPDRAAGLNVRNDRPDVGNMYYGSKTVPPAVNVLAVTIGPLKPGERATQLGAKEYADYARGKAAFDAKTDPDPQREPMLATLWHRQVDPWTNSLGAFGGSLKPFAAAALFASTRNLYLHNKKGTDFTSVLPRPLSTAGLADHDVTHWLVRGQAVLLLISDTPGPTTLNINGTPKETEKGHTIYRVRIPIDYVGRPPMGNTR